MNTTKTAGETAKVTRINRQEIPKILKSLTSFGDNIKFSHNGFYLCGVGHNCLKGSKGWNYTYKEYQQSIRIRKVGDESARFLDYPIRLGESETLETITERVKKILSETKLK